MEENAERPPENIENAYRIVREYGGYIRLIIRGYAKNDAEAEDLFQDFVIHLIEKPIPSNVLNIKAFLRTTLMRDAIDARRRIKRYRAHVEKYGEYSENSVKNSPPEDAIVKEEQLNALLGAFEHHLQRREFRAISLRFRESKDNAEIARIMGVRDGSVSRYICTGLKKMREIMDGWKKGREQ